MQDPSPSDSLRERLSRGEPLSLGTREQNLQNHSPAASVGVSPVTWYTRAEPSESQSSRKYGCFHLVGLRAQRSERTGASESLAVRDLARGIDN
jgi:hypothetical protein